MTEGQKDGLVTWQVTWACRRLSDCLAAGKIMSEYLERYYWK